MFEGKRGYCSCLLLGHIWRCSGLSLGPMFRVHSWWGLGDPSLVLGLNQVSQYKANALFSILYLWPFSFLNRFTATILGALYYESLLFGGLLVVCMKYFIYLSSLFFFLHTSSFGEGEGMGLLLALCWGLLLAEQSSGFKSSSWLSHCPEVLVPYLFGRRTPPGHTTWWHLMGTWPETV